MQFRHSVSIHQHKRAGASSCSLSLQVSVCGQRKDIALGISVPVGAYNASTRSIADAPLDNLHLQEAIARVNRIFLDMEYSQEPASLSAFLVLYNKVCGSPSASVEGRSLLSVLDDFIREQSVVRSWSDSTITKFHVLRNRFSDFRPNSLINDITEEWLTAFVLYLQQGYTRTRKDGVAVHYYYRNTSLFKMLKQLRWFLRWAKHKGIYTAGAEDFSMDFKGGSEPLSDIVFLTPDELHALADHTWAVNEQHLERVVDVFLFACYCGLRYSDIATLKRSHIHDDQIFVTTEKTAVSLSIPLNATTRRILEKYSSFHDAYDHPFPVISDQKSNAYLKKAAAICGLNATVNYVWYQGNVKHEQTQKKCDCISFHCARRTFVTIALLLGIPDSVLIQFTGHTSTKMLKRYQGIVDSMKRQQISKFDSI